MVTAAHRSDCGSTTLCTGAFAEHVMVPINACEETSLNEPPDVRPDHTSRVGRLASALGPVGLLAGMAGVGTLTFALVTVGAGGPRNASFIASANYLLWRLLVVLLVLTSLVAAAIAWPRLVDVRRRYPSATPTPLVLAYPLGILITAALPWLTQQGLAVQWNMLSVRIGVVVIIVAIAVAPTLGTLWIIRFRVGELARREAIQSDEGAARIGELLALRRMAATALSILAAIISLTVINTGQLRHSYLAAGALQPEEWPIAGVILYGAFFAGLLALLYVPVHLRWRDSAEALREALYPIPSHGRPDAEWSEGRKRLSDLLLLDMGVPGVLGTIFTVGSPLLISLLGYLVPASG
jgi:hypothetical protein